MDSAFGRYVDVTVGGGADGDGMGGQAACPGGPGSGNQACVRRRVLTTKRTCLGCDQMFESWGAGNRLCKTCRNQADADLPVAWRGFDGRFGKSDEFVSA